MSVRNPHTNEDLLHQRHRRRAIILLLAAGLVRMHGGEGPPEESAESSQNPLGSAPETPPCVPVG